MPIRLRQQELLTSQQTLGPIAPGKRQSVLTWDGRIVEQIEINGQWFTLTQESQTISPSQPPTKTSPTTSPQSTAPPPANVTELQNLLRSIPIAVPGAVISSEYHNALRGAVMALGQALGVTFASPFDVVSLTPSFHKTSGAKAGGWSIGEFRAEANGDINAVSGWQSVSLPDGAVVKSMTVTGKQTKNLKTLAVGILRYPIGNNKRPEAVPSYILTSRVHNIPDEQLTAYSQQNVPLDALSENEKALAGVNLPNVLMERTRIDNTQYRYILEATATFTAQSQSPDVTIDSIQIRCN